MRIYDEPQVKLLKASFNIDALKSFVVPLIDEHEVWVDFPATILTNNDSEIVSLSINRVNTRHWSILEKGRRWEPCLTHDEAKLGERQVFVVALAAIIVVYLKVSYYARFQIFNN